jgi:secretion/DNA translocation related TadE-like protein
MMAVLLAATFGAVQVGSAVIARHRAQAAADMAALAAASLMPAGLPAACDKAAAVARAMRTAVSSCTADALDVTVTVDAQLPLAPTNIGPARAAARGNRSVL